MAAAKRPLTRSRRCEKYRWGCPTVHQSGPPSLPQTRSTPWACNRSRAKAGRSHHHLPGTSIRGLKCALAPGSTAQKAARTSSPTSKAWGPMQGPSQASQWAFGWWRRNSANKDSTTPWPSRPHRPRQPAWAAATTRPRSSLSSIGRQSATIMQQAVSGPWLQQASASVPSGQGRACTPQPCTCFKKTGRVPKVCVSCRRLAATASGASPTWSPRLKLS